MSRLDPLPTLSRLIRRLSEHVAPSLPHHSRGDVQSGAAMPSHIAAPLDQWTSTEIQMHTTKQLRADDVARQMEGQIDD